MVAIQLLLGVFSKIQVSFLEVFMEMILNVKLILYPLVTIMYQVNTNLVMGTLLHLNVLKNAVKNLEKNTIVIKEKQKQHIL